MRRWVEFRSETDELPIFVQAETVIGIAQSADHQEYEGKRIPITAILQWSGAAILVRGDAKEVLARLDPTAINADTGRTIASEYG